MHTVIFAELFEDALLSLPAADPTGNNLGILVTAMETTLQLRAVLLPAIRTRSQICHSETSCFTLLGNSPDDLKR
jgi:hypothetical protein